MTSSPAFVRYTTYMGRPMNEKIIRTNLDRLLCKWLAFYPPLRLQHRLYDVTRFTAIILNSNSTLDDGCGLTCKLGSAWDYPPSPQRVPSPSTPLQPLPSHGTSSFPTRPQNKMIILPPKLENQEHRPRTSPQHCHSTSHHHLEYLQIPAHASCRRHSRSGHVQE